MSAATWQLMSTEKRPCCSNRTVISEYGRLCGSASVAAPTSSARIAKKYAVRVQRSRIVQEGSNPGELYQIGDDQARSSSAGAGNGGIGRPSFSAS